MIDRRQIRAYVTSQERDLFKNYAQSVGLDQSSLLVLLMLRAGQFGLPEWERVGDASRRVVSGKAKITAHLKESAVYVKVASLSEKCPSGLSQVQICGALVRLELEERWMGRIVL